MNFNFIKSYAKINLSLNVVGKTKFNLHKILKSGQSGPALLKLEEKIVAAHRDRFIIRLFSPIITIGGDKDDYFLHEPERGNAKSEEERKKEMRELGKPTTAFYNKHGHTRGYLLEHELDQL